MNANARRGEIVAELSGKRHRLCLTLGALAELESAFAADDLSALVARFSSGKLSARDMARVIDAGLRGAGDAISDDEVMALETPGGAAGYARIVADLLTATFGAADVGGTGSPKKKISIAASGPAGPAAFPWDAVMTLGLGSMRLHPEAFWAMTPREFAFAAGLAGRASPYPDRASLAELMRRYPDAGKRPARS